jgi:hypothetical protein
MSCGTLSYTYLRNTPVARTVQVSDGIMVDLDERDRVVGVESISGEDWRDGLAALAMAGRLAVPRRTLQA